MTNHTETPPVCDYEGSDYQHSFWDEGGRAYEDAAEAIALNRLLPARGEFLLELGAGAGRNTPRYSQYQRIALLDYSRTQLEQARNRLGSSNRYLYVAADIYHLPFMEGVFDGATMIRTLHHMADPELALTQVQAVMRAGGVFILEFANKRNLKAMIRYLVGKQTWNPYTQEPVEFEPLNFDFHPTAVRHYLVDAGFEVEKQLSVSHFRVGFLKRVIPVRILAGMDSLLQWTGAWVQVTPSVFSRCRVVGNATSQKGKGLFKCPVCQEPLEGEAQDLVCEGCGTKWLFRDGIYDFRIKKGN